MEHYQDYTSLAVENAIATVRLEGIEPSPETIADLERVAKGEMTIEEGISRTLARHCHE